MKVEYTSQQPNSIVLRLIVNTLSIFTVAWVLPGIHVTNMVTAVIIAVFLAVLNVTLKPLLILFTLPITIVSLGFFLLVINAIIIFFVASWVDGFEVDGFWWAVLFSILISFVNSVLYKLGNRQG